MYLKKNYALEGSVVVVVAGWLVGRGGEGRETAAALHFQNTIALPLII